MNYCLIGKGVNSEKGNRLIKHFLIRKVVSGHIRQQFIKVEVCRLLGLASGWETDTPDKAYIYHTGITDHQIRQSSQCRSMPDKEGQSTHLPHKEGGLQALQTSLECSAGWMINCLIWTCRTREGPRRTSWSLSQ